MPELTEEKIEQLKSDKQKANDVGVIHQDSIDDILSNKAMDEIVPVTEDEITAAQSLEQSTYVPQTDHKVAQRMGSGLAVNNLNNPAALSRSQSGGSSQKASFPKRVLTIR